MAIKTIDILNVLIFQRQWRKNNGDCKSGKIQSGDTISDIFHLDFCDGINVIIGENGVGKTSLLKMIYAATQWSIKQTNPGKTKRLLQFFSNSISSDEVLKNSDYKEGYCYYRVSDGAHQFEYSLSHQGIFDLSFFSIIPNLIIMAPKDFKELENMLEYAVRTKKACCNTLSKRKPRKN